jgi:MoaA/NifB/PqqE/SkfB family radical SAM enzyme
VTNACNAAWDFCSYARNKAVVTERRWIDRRELARALPILYQRGARYLNFQGGEPLLHRGIEGMVADAKAAGLRPARITNGWLLPQKIEALADAGLNTLLVSLDSDSIAKHERNRGLRGLGERMRQGVAASRRHRIPALASVTVSRLVRYQALAPTLRLPARPFPRRCMRDGSANTTASIRMYRSTTRLWAAAPGSCRQ